jgi:large subunit ribosomal protein L18e
MKSNYQLQQLLLELGAKAPESNFWRRVLKDLNKSSRQRREVNVYKIDRYAKEGETILVPGKVLSMGDMGKSVSVAAFNFSGGAKEKIIAAKGKVLSISELMKQNPEGKKVRILG